MPPRLNKRQQREQEELQSLATTPVQVPEAAESSEDDAPVSTKPAPSGFAALAQSEVVVEDDEDDEPDTPQKSARKKNKKKKKKEAPKVASEVAPSPQQQKSSGKKGKQVKESGDELDRALAELSVKYPDLQQVARSTKSTSAAARSFADKQNALLAVSLAHLDSEAEMRKFFGSKVISASKAQDKQPRGARAALKGLKSNLTKPQPTWWSASQREGLSIRLLTGDELAGKEARSKLDIEEKGERWWTVEYSKRYRNVTKAFMGAVLSGDPDRLYKILSKLPWHADTLLQMSEVYRHREEHSSNVDFLNRALFTYERSFIGAFAFTAGSNRLDFDHVENRPFYLALSRSVADLQRRGVSRTSFEFARLLLSLDPYTDPHGALLFLDFLSIKTGMHEWLLSLWDLHEGEASKSGDAGEIWERFNVTVLPGWSYARALALRATEDAKKGDHERSTAALKEAVLSFPAVIPLLADKADIFLPGDLRGHPDFRVHVDASSLSGHEPLIQLLSHLYVHRSSSLWKIPETAAWLKETVLSVYESYGSHKKSNRLRERFSKQFSVGQSYSSNPTVTEKDLYRSNLARSIYRHVGVLADANTTRRLNAFFPREILDAPSLSCDPLPPHTAVSLYDDDFFADCEDVFAYRPRTRREREADARVLARMIPDANVRNQIQALYDTRPDIQRQFPDGVTQFAQIAAQLGEDFWDNLVPQMVHGEGAGGGGGGMPGQFAVDGEEIEEDEEHPGNASDDDIEDAVEDEEGSEGEEEPAPTFPVRVWQNLVNRVRGGVEPADGAQRPNGGGQN